MEGKLLTFATIDFIIGGALQAWFTYSAPHLDMGLLVRSAYDLVTTSEGKTYSLNRFSSQSSWFLLVYLRPILWATWCVNWWPLHKFWQIQLPKKIRLMPGGFAPRPSALTLGILLFVSQTLIEEQTIQGSSLASPSAFKDGMVCFADHTMPNDLSSSDYIIGWNFGPADGCFKTNPNQTGNIWYSQPPFYKEDVAASPENLVHPVLNNRVMKDLLCEYMCVTKRNVEAAGVVQKMGVIVTGAAIAIVLSDSLTTRFGWHLVTEDTPPKKLKELLTGWLCRGLGSHGFHGSATACALQIYYFAQFASLVSGWLLGHTSYHSVDFKVNYVIIFGVLFASIQRWWSPMTLRGIAFTKTMWMEGQDEFHAVEKSAHDGTYYVKKQKIDLYTWNHMHPVSRALSLFRYCMRIDSDAKAGTPVRCIIECEEYGVDKEGTVYNIGWEALSVVCREKHTIPVGTTGILVKDCISHTGKVIVKWDSPVNKETLIDSFHIIENTKEWNELADDFTAELELYVQKKRKHKKSSIDMSTEPLIELGGETENYCSKMEARKLFWGLGS